MKGRGHEDPNVTVRVSLCQALWPSLKELAPPCQARSCPLLQADPAAPERGIPVSSRRGHAWICLDGGGAGMTWPDAYSRPLRSSRRAACPGAREGTRHPGQPTPATCRTPLTGRKTPVRRGESWPGVSSVQVLRRLNTGKGEGREPGLAQPSCSEEPVAAWANRRTGEEGGQAERREKKWSQALSRGSLLGTLL